MVQEELLSPASMQYSLPSPLGHEPYWQEVSSMECAPIATTEEDTLMEMSEVQVWPSGNSPSLVTVEDSSLECSNADDSEGLLYGSLGRPGSVTPGGGCVPRGLGGTGGLSSSIELLEDQSIGADSEHSAAPTPSTSGGVNINGLDRGQGLETDKNLEEPVSAAGRSISGGANGGIGGGEGSGLEEGLSLITGQQRVYARMSESPGLSRVADRNGDR